MAADSASSNMDYKAHNNTYAGFVTLFKWGTVVAAIATAGVVAILVY